MLQCLHARSDFCTWNILQNQPVFLPPENSLGTAVHVTDGYGTEISSIVTMYGFAGSVPLTMIALNEQKRAPLVNRVFGRNLDDFPEQAV